jgi:hypothetical protein
VGRLDPAEAAAFERAVLLKFVADYLQERGSFFPADYYRRKYSIPAARLRQAARRGHLTAVRVGSTKHYLLADVQRLWPDDVE